MKPVTYKPNPDCQGGMEVHRYGKYVSEAEYNELKKQVERLAKAGDACAWLACFHYDHGDINKDKHSMKVLDEWEAAKEGNPQS